MHVNYDLKFNPPLLGREECIKAECGVNFTSNY